MFYIHTVEYGKKRKNKYLLKSSFKLIQFLYIALFSSTFISYQIYVYLQKMFSEKNNFCVEGYNLYL